MPIPTEPVGSMPRPAYLVDALAAGSPDVPVLTARAVAETIARFEATESPVVTDGEQAKPSFATYPLSDPDVLRPDGAVIPFADGHTRQLPALARAPFRYDTHAASYLLAAQSITDRPVKQAVIAPSALSLLYPDTGIDGYPRDAFLDDLADASEQDIRQCLDAGASSVQLDFTEGRLALVLDPSGGVLDQFVALNNRVLERFSDSERARIAVHSCPGGDRDSTHSAQVDYADLLPALFRISADAVFLELAGEPEPERVLALIARHARPEQRIFVGVTDPINPRVETAEEVRDRVLVAAEHLPVDRLGTTDDCGFSPFADDTSTSRDVAFAKVTARIEGTALAAAALGV